MADIGAIKSFIGGLPPDHKLAIEQCFTYVLNNLSFGAVDTERTARATNFQAYYLTGTTSSNANTEFSIPHGLDSAPSVLFPVLPLDQIGSQVVPLQVSRAADGRRVYLKSSSTSAAIAVMVG
jgi:hypothetical protein